MSPSSPSTYHRHHQLTINSPSSPSTHHRHHQLTIVTINSPSSPSTHHRHHKLTIVIIDSPLSPHHYTSLPLIFMGTNLSIMPSISSFKTIQHSVVVLSFIELVQIMRLICLCLPLYTFFIHLPVLPVCILILKWIWLWSLDPHGSYILISSTNSFRK